MAEVQLLVPKILKWEGGYVNHPNDKGGPTNKGITIGTYQSYRKKRGMPAPRIAELKNISDEEWMDILKVLYWDRWHADEIQCQSTANLVVDWVWGSGVWGIKYPQQVLGVTADGIVGPKTLAALNEYPDQKELFEKLWNRRKAHFESLASRDPSQKVFLKGWINRLNDYTF